MRRVLGLVALLVLLSGMGWAQSPQPAWTFNPSGAGLWTAPIIPFSFRAPVTFTDAVTLSGGVTNTGGLTFSGPIVAPGGSAAAPAFSFTGATNWGLRYQSSTIFITTGGSDIYAFGGNNLQIRTDVGAVYFGTGLDVNIGRAAANTIQQVSGNNPQFFRTGTGYGGYSEIGTATEEITLATGGLTTDSTANLLPADAFILSVNTRVTEAITTCANYSVGDATTAARFINGYTGVGLGSTKKGLLHLNPNNADAAGAVQTADAKIRITCDANPGAGKIRVQVAFIRPSAPSS